MSQKLDQLGATELLHAYRGRQLSPVEVTRAVLDQIQRRDSEINAFVLLSAESALDDSRRSEQHWQKGRPLGLLDGVPVSIKDLLLTRGWPTRRGSLTVSADGP